MVLFGFWLLWGNLRLMTYLGTDYLSVMNDISYFKNDSNTLSEENTL